MIRPFPITATVRATDPDTMRALLSDLGDQGAETSPGIVGITAAGIRQLTDHTTSQATSLNPATDILNVLNVGHKIVFGDVVTMPEIGRRTGYAYASVQSWVRRDGGWYSFPRPRWHPSPSLIMWDWWSDIAPWMTDTGRQSDRYPLTTGMELWSDLPTVTADVVDAKAVAVRSGYASKTVMTWLHRDSKLPFPPPRWFRKGGTKGRNTWDWNADVLPWLISTGRTGRMVRERPGGLGTDPHEARWHDRSNAPQ